MSSYTVFVGHRKLLAAPPAEVAMALMALPADAMPLVFDGAGRTVDIDTSGSPEAVLARLTPPPVRGRPRLGVVAREVTLLPRHWDWLATQPGGASVTLRRLIDAARRDDAVEARAARDAAYRFMTAVAGDLPRYEAALRALFAGDRAAFLACLADWPVDVRDHALALADAGLA